jgi:orotidine-5'-phosphate decarboxylase
MKDDVEYSKRIIVAIDDVSKDKMNGIIDVTAPFIEIYKIGSIAFTAFGPKIIDEIKSRNKEVFLDLKFFDIPNTVSKAVKQAVSYGVKMLTLHTLGGYEMLKAAVESNEGRATLLGVTLLTSLDASQLNRIGIDNDIEGMVQRLALLAMDAGIDGLVASGQELERLRHICGNKPVIVVPGIRLENEASNDDQKRIVSPKKAFDSGADYIVIGRPVTESNKPADTIKKIIKTLTRGER